MGVLGGTYASIATQRYNDSVRDFAEFLRQVYGEVISPESLGAANGDFGGNSDDYAIYGKVMVFGLNGQTTVHTATLVGSTDIPSGNNDFITELKNVGAQLFCGIEDPATGDIVNDTTVNTYTPLWESQVVDPSGNILTGTVIIARSPTSGTIHTAFNRGFTPDLANNCRPNDSNASSIFHNDLINNSNYSMTDDINFCIKSDQSKVIRDVLLTADGHNNTAINLLDDADSRNVCR